MEANLAKFISQDQHLKKNENGETPLHILAKKLHNEKIDTHLCIALINTIISVIELQGKLNSKVLDEQDNEGNTFLDIVKKAEELPHIDASKNKDKISKFVSNLKQKVERENTSETQNKTPKKEEVLITNARKELNRITTNGCGFFMSKEKHKVKVAALEKAIHLGNQTEISLALKMHRSIAPFHISNPESAKCLKR